MLVVYPTAFTSVLLMTGINFQLISEHLTESTLVHEHKNMGNF